MKRKTRAFLSLAMCLAIAGCSVPAADPQLPQSESANQQTESTEKTSVLDSAQIDSIGSLKLCDPFAGGGAATSDGYYYTMLRPDGNLNIHYLDYATHTDIILCSSPNCTHEDESCGSFIHSNGLVPGLAVVDKKLLIVGGGISVSEPTEGDLPYVEVMQLDGRDRKRVYRANASSEFGALLCDDQNFYTIERILETQDGIPVLTQHLVQIDLDTGEKTVLADMGANIIYPCDATGNTLYYYSIEPKEGSQSLSETVTKYYAYNVENKNTALIDALSSDSPKKFTVANGNLYLVDSQARQVLVKRMEEGAEAAVIKEFPIDTEFADFNIRCVIDEKIIVDEQQKKSDGTIQSVTHIIDCSTGSVELWPLYYDSTATAHPIQVEILAAQADTFLVRCGEEILDVKYGDDGTYTMLNPRYATIVKADFWDGTENYHYFS